MCGILGIWNRDGRPVDWTALTRATSALRHRGPDDEGYVLINTRTRRVVAAAGADTTPELGFPRLDALNESDFDLALGFRRLSILDLSPAGHQPMSSADGRFWIVFNGEIYNYRELRDELRRLRHDFHTGSDTEVILAAYREWGRGCVDRFNGMWAFAIWDLDRRELLVSRDRFGIKPLQYATPGSTFAFASELKALLVGGIVPFVPRVDAVVEFVTLAKQTSPNRGETFVEGIRALPAGHHVIVTRDAIEEQRYWSLPESQGDTATDAALIDEYRALFDSAVKFHLRADVLTGTLLSGGLDSSSIVATANQFLELARSGTDLKGLTQESFSAIYDDEGPWNERRFIDAVIQKTGVHPNFVTPTAEGLWREIGDMMWHHDEPIVTTSVYAEWSIMRLVRQRGITVVLVGQGADEIFGGYLPIFTAALRENLRHAALRQAWLAASAVSSNGPLSAARQLVGEAARMTIRRMVPSVPQRLHARRRAAALTGTALRPEITNAYIQRRGFGETPRPSSSVREQVVEWFNEYPLAHNLQWSDRNSMAFSVESRVPFLDYRLVEFVFRRADRLSLRDGWSKWLHRMSINGRLPDSVTWRRDKIGFLTPESRWITSSAPRLREHFSSPSDIERELFDFDAINRRIDTVGPNDAELMWRYAAAAAWLRRGAEYS